MSASTTLLHKAVLPRATGAVHDILDLMVGLPKRHSITQMVADVVDAFWLIPNHPRERT